MNAASALITAATSAQKELVAQGKVSSNANIRCNLKKNKHLGYSNSFRRLVVQRNYVVRLIEIPCLLIRLGTIQLLLPFFFIPIF